MSSFTQSPERFRITSFKEASTDHKAKKGSWLQRQESCNISRFEEDFEIIKCIGSGNFGKVYQCRHKIDNVQYAVKISNENVKNNIIDLALNEAVALASIFVQNENNYIVRYHSCFRENSKLYLVME